jgi:phosphate transport system permease protein
MANVPIILYQYAMSPYDNWNQLAWAGALILTLFVLALNLGVRLLTRKVLKR